MKLNRTRKRNSICDMIHYLIYGIYSWWIISSIQLYYNLSNKRFHVPQAVNKLNRLKVSEYFPTASFWNKRLEKQDIIWDLVITAWIKTELVKPVPFLERAISKSHTQLIVLMKEKKKNLSAIFYYLCYWSPSTTGYNVLEMSDI